MHNINTEGKLAGVASAFELNDVKCAIDWPGKNETPVIKCNLQLKGHCKTNSYDRLMHLPPSASLE